MKIEKVNPNIKYVYHYTLKSNAQKILQDKAIVSKDEYVFFTESLRESVLAFEREMMQDGKLYIDVDGVLRKREKCKKEDYCILKLPYKNDNKFCKFTFENQSKESIYGISICHKGAYSFENAKVLEFPKEKKLNLLSKTAIAALFAGIIIFPNNIYGASWLDSGNYDTSWYNGNAQAKYVLTNAKELAGFAHLINNENITFKNQKIEIGDNIDLTTNTWQTIKDIFEGTICGSHRVILSYLSNDFMDNKNFSFVYRRYNTLINGTTSEQIDVAWPYRISDLKNVIGQNAEISFNGSPLLDDTRIETLNMGVSDVLNVNTPQTLYIEDTTGKKGMFDFVLGTYISNVKSTYARRYGINVNKVVIKYGDVELENNKVLSDYGIQKNDVLKAYFKVNISANVKAGKGAFTLSQVAALSGDKVKITVTPEAEYELDKIVVNGVDKTSEVKGNVLEFVCGEDDVKVDVTYKKIVYGVLEGANSVYTVGKNEELKFRIDADFSLFDGKVYVDGNLVQESNYVAESGSTIITFKQSYLNTLGVGKHTLKVVFANGTETTIEFTIAKGVSNPNTSDNIIVYVAILGMSVCGISIVLKKTRRNIYEE